MKTRMLGISADFEGCEIRVAAALSGDKALLEAETSGLCYKHSSTGCCESPHTGLHWMAAHAAFGPEATKEHRYWCKRGIFCVPEQGTEILTRRGWLKHDEVKSGDETLGLAPDGKLRWTEVTEVHHPGVQPMERLSAGKTWAAVATPDHRWATVKRRDGGSRGRYFESGMTAQKDLGREHNIVLSAVADTENELPVSAAEAALIAWAYTDGHIEQSPLTGRTSQGLDGRRRKLRVRVIQAKPEGIENLEAVLREAGADFTCREKKTATLPCRVYTLKAGYARDLWQRAGLFDVADKAQFGFDLECFVLKLGTAERAAFVQACVDAEGFVNKLGQRELAQNAGPVHDAIQLAATLDGYFVREYPYKTYTGNVLHKQVLAKPRTGLTRVKRTEEPAQPAWCVTTGLGTWVMRQEGRVMLTGNCKLFGGGPATAAEQVYCDVSSMQAVFRAFEDLAPVYTDWDKWLRQCYKEGSLVWRDYETGTNYSQKIEGERRMVYRAYSGRNIYITNGEHAAGNGAIQGTARELLVDGTLLWKQTRWGRLPLLPVHDQIIAFVPELEAQEATVVLAWCMETRVLSSPGFEVLIAADTDVPFASWPDSS